MRAGHARSAVLLALALALAALACSAPAPEAAPPPAPTAIATPEATSTPAPTATATPEAASTPAPTAIATPEATSTPEPTPEQACTNGVAVAEPEAHPGLVADCEALLRAKDALRGDASLDWGGGLAVADWEGVAVSGEPPRVTGLDLRNKGLTGSIPRELRRLRLGEVRLAGNALSGCVPSAFEDASTHDIASLGLPWCLRYDRLDAAGEVAEAGEWAILGGNGEVLATWMQLRSEAATLRIHQTDAGGTSWAAEFGAVDEGSLIEWREKEGCWVLYRVAGAPSAPAPGSPHWEFPVELFAHAGIGHTPGGNCSGSPGVIRADEAAPGRLRTADIQLPVLYGPYLIAPAHWRHLDYSVRYEPPPESPEPGNIYVPDDLAEAKRLLSAYWRDPALPQGWTFWSAGSGGGIDYPHRGYCASYGNEEGYIGAIVCVSYMEWRPEFEKGVKGDEAVVTEARLIDGYPAILRYSPLGPAHDWLWAITVRIFDPATGRIYDVLGYDRTMIGANVDAVIAVARSLLPSAADAASTPPPEQACANGVAVVDPEAHPGLVADCEALLRAKDALRGDASLDWGGGLAVEEWEGVTVSGEPPRVTDLDLRGKGLTGSIPRELRRLRLDEALFAGNALSGCVPSAFEDASTHDIASLGLPWCLRYDRLDAAGEVAGAGEWAILGGSGEVLTTWMQLRSEAATLRIHQTDAGGTSWASEFGAVAEGSLIEWREKEGCWVLYRVAGAPSAPAPGFPHWEFPVELFAHAGIGHTPGGNCSGSPGVIRADEAAPGRLRTADIRLPVLYGPYLIAPAYWPRHLDYSVRYEPPPESPEPGTIAVYDLAEVRRLLSAYWRDPELPPDWDFVIALSGGHSDPTHGYCASYNNAEGYIGARICVWYMEWRPMFVRGVRGDEAVVTEARLIDGYPAILRYSPLGPAHDWLWPITVRIFDPATGRIYDVRGYDRAMAGSNVDAVIAVARSLLPE